MPAEEIETRIRAARAAQALWRETPLIDRIRAIRALWARLRAKAPEICRTLHEETGKPLAEIEMMELAGAELLVKHFTRSAYGALGDQAVPRPWPLMNKRAYVRYVPRGLVALITPFNYPFMLPLGDAVPALLAGDAVLLKPSEWTPRTALLLESIALESGALPKGLLQVFTGGGEVGQALIAEADMVVFTGSTRTGKLVAKAAAERLIPCVLELGGKHAMIVCADAALPRAVKAAVWGRMANCGQTCVGVERVLVEREAYKPFVDAVLAETAKLRQGVESHYDLDVGRLIFPGQAARVAEHIEDARGKGALVVGDGVVDAAKGLVRPTVVADATWRMKIMHEETFGPVLPIMPVGSAEEAVALANESPLGLSGSVWSEDGERARRLGERLEVGQLGLNDCMGHYAIGGLPFGGFKQSGLGRRHGEEGLRMFCQTQSVLEHEWPSDAPEPWWFPYSRLKARLVALLARLS